MKAAGLFPAVAFALLTALCAQVAVPMAPVPMTLQTFAILMGGVLLGPVWGGGAALIYLAMAAAGLPVLSDGAGGLASFSGPTAGYLVAFPIAAALAGLLAQRTKGLVALTAGLFGLHLLILALGAGWLATKIGVEAAIEHGVTPFLIGAAVKSAMVALIGFLALRRASGRRVKRG
ncbi:biotin transporter BioY [Brevundimonas sp. Root1279]|uniref:biotin transporter BioY n=1 Tax=Brevundimonas sp. Root1279 TaxID=1736443 RepID=UPI0006F24485|nr:biotin transporter BioY [Brevundimonas sp. Root1279]KQW81834.1 hypothetical protein ASC65_11130 [Brevundimonas sp. Root1279]